MGIVVCLLCRYDCDLHWDPHLLGEIVVIRGVFFLVILSGYVLLAKRIW